MISVADMEVHEFPLSPIRYSPGARSKLAVANRSHHVERITTFWENRVDPHFSKSPRLRLCDPDLPIYAHQWVFCRTGASRTSPGPGLIDILDRSCGLNSYYAGDRMCRRFSLLCDLFSSCVCTGMPRNYLCAVASLNKGPNLIGLHHCDGNSRPGGAVKSSITTKASVSIPDSSMTVMQR
jgi:hypothetical protein